MKKSELRQIIKEEIQKVISESVAKKGDIVTMEKYNGDKIDVILLTTPKNTKLNDYIAKVQRKGGTTEYVAVSSNGKTNWEQTSKYNW